MTSVARSRRRGDEGAADSPGAAMQRILWPHSVAVVGASEDPKKRGHQAIAALQALGFPHPIYPVNPSGGTILGLPVARSIAQIEGSVDLALIATPATTVPAVVGEAAAAGVGGVVVIAVGFAESGTAGTALEHSLRRIAAETGIRVIGPNTSGIFNTHAAINLVGVPDVPAGPISVLTQSGNMLLSLIEDARAVGGLGFATYVGVGNQTDVGFGELLAAVSGDGCTGAIAMHCEGLHDGRALLADVHTAARRVPLVILKGGRSEAGRRAALSHTAALAGSAVVSDALLRQAGAELVHRSDELAAVTSVLAGAATAPGPRVAVLADGGGHATLCADALSSFGLPLADLSLDTRERLLELYGPAASVANPVDVAGATDEDPLKFSAGAELLLADDGVDLLVIVGLFGGYQVRFGAHLAEVERAAAVALAERVAASGKPAVLQSSYATHHTEPQRVVNARGLPVLASIDHAARAAAALANRARFLRTAARRSTFAPLGVEVDEGVGGSPPRLLSEPDGRRFLSRCGLGDSLGVGVDSWRVVGSSADASRAVAALGGRCAMKIVSQQVVHKSDVGGVLTDVGVDGAAEAFDRLLTAVTVAMPDARVDGVLVTPMAARGIELLIGASRDPTFGPIIAFGAGGTLVEMLGPPAFRSAPVTPLEAAELLDSQPLSPLLDGYRGAAPVDRALLAQTLVDVSQMFATHPEIVELDLNPVIAGAGALTAVDVRIVVDG